MARKNPQPLFRLPCNSVLRGMLLLPIALCLMFLPRAALSNEPLTLAEAEALALLLTPELSQLEARRDALEQKSIAVGQLPDPELTFGTLNVPVDTFDFDQDPMTKIQVGLEQAFPKGRTLSLRKKQTINLAQAEQASLEDKQIEVLRAVRTQWFELHYWQQADALLRQEAVLFRHLVQVTESLLAAAKQHQKDVLRAQLELSNVENQQIAVVQQMYAFRSDLARWIGNEAAAQPISQALPNWPTPPPANKLSAEIYQHPVLKTDTALVDAKRQGVKLAQQEYIPGWKMGVHYGFRQGSNTDSSNRPDLLSAQISLDLPIFPARRQAREVKSSLEMLSAAEQGQEASYRRLTSEVGRYYALWEQFGQQLKFYNERVIPEAQQYAQATLTAYQNNQAIFSDVADAYVEHLNAQLAALRIAVEHYKAHAVLLYLQGK